LTVRHAAVSGSSAKIEAVKGIRRREVRQLLTGGAQLIEVLPREEYEEEHLPGAINIPLKELNRETAKQLDRSRPVIVYCHDYQ
jgi:rhodanese-related sulfurtransferase